LKEESF